MTVINTQESMANTLASWPVCYGNVYAGDTMAKKMHVECSRWRHGELKVRRGREPECFLGIKETLNTCAYYELKSSRSFPENSLSLFAHCLPARGTYFFHSYWPSIHIYHRSIAFSHIQTVVLSLFSPTNLFTLTFFFPRVLFIIYLFIFLPFEYRCS